MNILHIQSSPRGEDSHSINLTTAFVHACQAADASVSVDTLNVWDENLPEFDHHAIGAKYKAIRQTGMTAQEAAIWHRIKSLIGRFQQADRIILGTPMWNFSIPYKLKQLIDLVAQRNFLFTYDGSAYGPALAVSKAITVYSRGSRYLEGTPIPPSRYDHQANYVDFWLDLIGVAMLRSVVVDNAWNQDDAQSAQSIAAGRASLLGLVGWFLERPPGDRGTALAKPARHTDIRWK